MLSRGTVDARHGVHRALNVALVCESSLCDLAPIQGLLLGEIRWGSSLVFCAPDTSERFWPPKLELLKKPGPAPPDKRNQWFLMFSTGDERLGLSTRV